MLTIKKTFIPVLLLGLLTTACVVQKNPVTGTNRAMGFSWERAKEIGAQADKQIQAQFGVYEDQALQQYVDAIAQDVLSDSDMRDEGTAEKYANTEFTFRILDTPVVNAFALPGGYVYVTRGLLAHLKNEAQLAVVLGHEIGHIAARHASQSAFERQISQIALLGGAIAGQEFLGIPGGQILQLGNLARTYLFTSYSRDDEREADALGVEYAARQNYAAAEGAGFFEILERMSQQTAGGIPNWLSTHPDPAERAQTIPQLAEEMRQKGYEMAITGTDQYMNEINNIVYGKNPRQGFTRNGVFYHPELAFQFSYPQSWNLINTPTAVQIVNQDQNAIIIFGIDSENTTPETSIQEFLRQEGVNPVSASPTQSHGLNAYEATATAQTQNGAQVSFYLYSVEYDGNVYRYVTYTLSEQFTSVRDIFLQTTNDFQPLNDASILGIEPVRLNVYRANNSAAFQTFIPSSFPFEITAEGIAITNHTYLDETIQPGTWVKIPQQ